MSNNHHFKPIQTVVTGSDETSEPQPIPPLLLGSDREWLTLDPHVVRYWVSKHSAGVHIYMSVSPCPRSSRS